MKIHIIAAALPPLLDGIGDYTANLAAELAHSATVTVLTGAPAPDSIPGVQVETAFAADDPRSVWNLVDRVAADPPDWVLLQYNPFSYGRWGLNLHLPRVMQGIKRRCPGTRFALMVHESFVPVTSWQFGVMATWQRWQFWQLGQCADLLFFSMEGWANKFRAQFPQAPSVHLPVGSNIPYLPVSRDEARAGLKIADDTLVLGLFGTMHISRMLDRVKDAVQTAHQATGKALVLYVGPHGPAVKSALDDTPLLIEGPLAGKEISRRFAAMDIYLTPYSDGISTRRGTVMCGLQHGVAMVGTQGYNTDEMLKREQGKAFLLADANNPQQFKDHILHLVEQPLQRKAVADSGQEFFMQHFTWERIGSKLLAALEAAT